MRDASMKTHSYPYRLQGPSVSLIGLLIAIFGGLMLFMAWSEPDRFIGLPVGSPVGALLYGALAAIAFGVIFMMARAWLSQRNGERQIIFMTDRVLLPKSPFTNQLIAIPYASIKSVRQQSASRAAMRFIVIKHDKGHTQIANFGFQTTEAFEAVFEELRKKVG